jgi:hypothetical protein
MTMKMLKKNFEILAAAGMVLVGMVALALAQGGGFQFFGPLSRFLTPNGSYNRYAVFCFDNPSDSGVEGKIFTMFGSQVADMGAQQVIPNPGPSDTGCPAGVLNNAYFLRWDGRANGVIVHSGLYVYQIKAEGLTFSGTLLVVR